MKLKRPQKKQVKFKWPDMARQQAVAIGNNSTWLRCQRSGCNFQTQDTDKLSYKYGLCMPCLEKELDFLRQNA